ncbi:hypothetical protein Hdeb2414_s0017g00500811 [Helianthus debilis subsp. tardiflorus]
MAEHITKTPHVLLFPFPAQGHINPIFQFGKRLLSKGVKTTLVTTIYINSTLPHNTTTNMEAISDGFDEGGLSSADSPEENYVYCPLHPYNQSPTDLPHIRKIKIGV